MAIYGWFGCCVLSISCVNPQAAEVVDEMLQHFSVYAQTNQHIYRQSLSIMHSALNFFVVVVVVCYMYECVCTQ